VSVNAESRALRDARRDIPKALQRGELATAADIYLKLGLVARQDFKNLPDELRAGVSTLFAKRAWSHLHGLAVRAEKHPPLVADDATWWCLLVATAQSNDLGAPATGGAGPDAGSDRRMALAGHLAR
jgi:predicted nicotinamide N-methyase